jgi:predicted TIM-barrel fold metal-dependent hydrolase
MEGDRVTALGAERDLTRDGGEPRRQRTHDRTAHMESSLRRGFGRSHLPHFLFDLSAELPYSPFPNPPKHEEQQAMNAARPPVIDCHQHVHSGGLDTAGLILYLDKLGIDKCWALSWEAVDGGLDHAYHHCSIQQVFEAHAQHPDRIIPFAGVDCRRENAERTLREWHARGARGYGEIKWHCCYDSWDAIRMFRLAGELGMPVILHLQYPNSRMPDWWYGGHISALERAAKACPDTVFLGHAQSWWTHISGDADPERLETAYPKGAVTAGGEVPRLLAEYPNLYADLSAGSGFNALTRDPEFGRKFLIDFADKLLYGVDGSDDRLIQYVRSLDLPVDVRGKIMGGNAFRLLAG